MINRDGADVDELGHVVLVRHLYDILVYFWLETCWTGE